MKNLSNLYVNFHAEVIFKISIHNNNNLVHVSGSSVTGHIGHLGVPEVLAHDCLPTAIYENR